MGKGGFEPPTSQFRTEINAEIHRFQYHSKLDHLPKRNPFEWNPKLCLKDLQVRSD